ncbi:MAG: phosphate permease [Gammaproteobacteria bacterium RIFCSPHIGHO2_02_FULL_42_13]|nr:MAG: phosphate permease [Gammaproteobacteria bacterium RIFCSPHIGHO2_02_FULL_42_13]OGT70739.1 MAG: phosphate permease [Gammaproteobacteria bacterium RIFCSPLOWO2_02_FULL_42_9]
MPHSLFYLISASAIGFLMTWGVGANDLANILSTTIGSRSLTIRQVVIIAIIFETAGAFIGGVHVTNTIRSGIINVSLLANTPEILVDGMLATLLSGMTWIWFASFVGMPVSITNSIVGALVGFGALVLGVHAVHWRMVLSIALTWVFAPCFAALMSYLLFTLIRTSVLGTANPCHSARYWMPVFFFLIGTILSFMIILKDLSQFHLEFSVFWEIIITFIVSLLIMLLGLFLCRKLYHRKHIRSRHHRLAYVEKLFGILMMFTACAMIFAHGSNDIAIAIGPMTAIFNIVQHKGHLVGLSTYPGWILLFGTVGVLSGVLIYGRKVMHTVGRHITNLTPSRAFAATISAAGTVILATSAGVPVSATQTLVGGVLGVGLARGIAALNLRIIRNIFLSWIVTVPVAAGLAIGFYYLLRTLLHLVG